MRLAAGSVFLTFAVFFNSIESIRSQPTTLGSLFPGYNGILPPVEEFLPQDTLKFHNFKKIGERHIEIPADAMLLARGHVIVGWEKGTGSIIKLCQLFGLENVHVVFDTNKDGWVTLDQDEFKRLGPGRLLPLVVARDGAVAKHVSKPGNPTYKQAHIRASKQANDRVDIVEREQVENLFEHRTDINESMRAIKKEYSQEYNRAFKLYLFYHGEHNITENRARHA